MPQDAFTLRYLCKELNDLFSGGKINKIIQPNNDEVVFTVYTGKSTLRLGISVNPASPRIGVVSLEKNVPLTAPNFCMLLRKHLLSATINKVSLVGYDRIVKIDITPSSEFFDTEPKVLFVELMGRYSNIILTENGKILGGNRGINVFDNGVRPLFVGKNYLLPPIGDKKEPNDCGLIQYFANYREGDFAQYICAGVQGLALSTARECVLLYEEQYADKSKNQFYTESFFDFFKKFCYEWKYAPCVITKEEELIDVCAFPYKSLDGETLSYEHLWQAEDFYFTQKEVEKDFNFKRNRILNVVSSALKKTKKKLTAINSKEKDSVNADENKIKGELILSNIYLIKQGQKSCALYNYYDNSTVEILLNENLSPSKNAEAYFKKYNKQKRTLASIEPQKETCLREISYLQSILDEVDLVENVNDLQLILNELEDYGLAKEKVKTNNKNKHADFREYEIEGFKIKVGRNNLENDRLTFTAKPNDVWLHVKDYHSSHVIICCNNINPNLKVVEYAAKICAYFSKARDGGKVEVVYTEKKNVKKPPKSKPGFCVYENFKSMLVEPDKCLEFLKTE